MAKALISSYLVSMYIYDAVIHMRSFNKFLSKNVFRFLFLSRLVDKLSGSDLFYIALDNAS